MKHCDFEHTEGRAFLDFIDSIETQGEANTFLSDYIEWLVNQNKYIDCRSVVASNMDLYFDSINGKTSNLYRWFSEAGLWEYLNESES